ncbi:MAG TPA: DUF4397 domain-containing protein [Gemmatimonadaceae bacterium]
MNPIRTTVAVLSAVTLAGCSYEKNTIQDITNPITGANVKFFNLGVNAPGVNFFANDAKVTAVSSTNCSPPPTTPNPACTTTGAEVTTGTAFGAAANAGLYNVVPAGSVSLAGKIAATADNNLSVASTTSNLENGKYYSFYTSGIYDATTKKMDAFVVEDPLPAFDYATAYVRFVNASANATGVTLFAKSTTTNVEGPIGSSVAYKAAGAFILIPAGVYDMNVRSGGSATNLVTLAAVSLAGGRVYTIALRGDMTVTSTTATNRPTLQSNANR